MAFVLKLMALAAACKTVDCLKMVHGLHASFIIAGSFYSILYQIPHLRDGKSFATRQVDAKQNGAVIFSLIVSFQWLIWRFSRHLFSLLFVGSLMLYKCVICVMSLLLLSVIETEHPVIQDNANTIHKDTQPWGPMIPHAILPPAFPVVLLSSCPPFPRSSGSAWTTTARPILIFFTLFCLNRWTDLMQPEGT